MSIEMKKLIKRLRCDLFADRATLKEAFDYAQMIADGSSNPPAVLTAVYVVTNTLARLIEESELRTDAIINTTDKSEVQLALQFIERLKEVMANFEEGLLSTEELGYQLRTYGHAAFEKFRREFICIWGTGYDPKEPETTDINYFGPDRGYTIDDFQRIADLEPGQAVTFNDSGVHTVVRIK